MTREEAIKILDCYDIGFYDLSGEKIPADKLVEAFDMAVDALSAEAVQRWIPCSERLPRQKGEYLVTYHPCYWDRVEPEVRVGIDTFRGKTSWAKKKYQKVIAWKPLPMAWEGADDE